MIHFIACATVHLPVKHRIMLKIENSSSLLTVDVHVNY